MKSAVFKFAALLVTSFVVLCPSNSSAAEFRLAIDTINGYLYTFTEMAVGNLADANDSSLVNGKSVGRFSFLISYDAQCLSFVEARKGSMLVEQGWQSFGYQTGVNGAQGLVRITAVADTGGANSPPILPRANRGEWVVLKFRTTNDRTFNGLCCPVNWHWLDCQDNVLADSTGNATWVADSLFSSQGFPVDLSTSFSTDVSRCDTVLGNSSKRFAVFSNGHICLSGCDCIDDRGDLNLNGLAYEIGDYTLYRDYFVYGGTVFSQNPTHRQSQIAASEVNGDDLPLRVSDLVHLARIISGETNPPPKINPSVTTDTARVIAIQSFDRLMVRVNSPQDIHGAFLRFDFSGTAGAPVKLDSAENLDFAYGLSSNEVRILLPPSEDLDTPRIPAGNRSILLIPFIGSVQAMESQGSNYGGWELPASISIIRNRGDLNGDLQFTPSDAVLELQCVFLGGNCSLDLADINCDGGLSPADVLEILFAVFQKTQLPCM